MRKFGKYLLFVFIPLIIVVGVNIWVDSRGIINESHIDSFVNDLSKSDIAIYENIPERMIAKKRIEMNQGKHFSKVVIGSSRILFLGKPIDTKVFNVAVSGGGLEDCISLYELLIKNSITFDTVVFSADPWVLNINHEDDRYEIFSENYFWSAFHELFSFKYFMDNVQLKDYKVWSGDENDFVRFTDGTIKYDKEYMDSDVNVIDYVNKETIYQLGNFETFDADYKNKALGFFKDVSKNHIVELFLLPYHPGIYKKLIERVPLVEETEKSFYNTKGENLNVIGSYNPDKYMLTDSNFYDAMHITEKGLKRIYDSRFNDN